ncbi:hypothetical protein MG293_004876 [Ovis ammon polii]|uniref:Uncharacterized protein n=1 Tax=Ovis ammon polii TaxID=230172 RepID=A0AAD4UJ37_OVIAM|nr:hypothetical protein MG293_004876 [Ovis ammon polii]
MGNVRKAPNILAMLHDYHVSADCGAAHVQWRSIVFHSPATSSPMMCLASVFPCYQNFPLDLSIAILLCVLQCPVFTAGQAKPLLISESLIHLLGEAEDGSSSRGLASVEGCACREDASSESRGSAFAKLAPGGKMLQMPWEESATFTCRSFRKNPGESRGGKGSDLLA